MITKIIKFIELHLPIPKLNFFWKVNLFKKVLILKNRQINAWIIFFLCIYIVFVIKLITIQYIDNNILFGIYSVVISFYILSRFAVAYFYEPDHAQFDKNYQPTISFAVPSQN